MKAFALIFVAFSLFCASVVQAQVMNFPTEKALWEKHFSEVSDLSAKGSGWKPFNRYAWFYGQRIDEKGFVPQGARWQAYLQTKEILKGKSATGPVWTHLGPANIAGRCQPIAVDPLDHNRILLGSASGGLWESQNAGQSWEPIDDQLPSLAVGAILFDENNPNTVYIGTGEGNNSADAVFGVGVMVSYDRGLTWEILGTGLDWNIGDGKCVNDLKMNPVDSTLVAATTAGIFRFSHGIWNQTLSGTATALVRHPVSKNIFYCSLGNRFGDSANGIYKSTNGGQAWVKLTNGFPASHGRVGLAICNNFPEVLYAGVSNTNGTMLGIWKSIDAGNSWVLVNNAANHYNGQGFYDLVIAVDPINPDKVFSGGIDIWGSVDGGINFVRRTSFSYPKGHPQYVHEDQHGWCFHPDNPNHVYAAGDGGIFESFDSGYVWQEITSGLVTAQFYNIDVSQSDFQIAMGGTQDNGTLNFSGADNSWTRAMSGDGFFCNIDYVHPDTIYFEQQFGRHYRSYNGGLTKDVIMTGIQENGNWNTPVFLDLENQSVLFTAHRRIYKSIDRGATWVPKTDVFPGTGVSIAESPSSRKILYVAYSALRTIYRSYNNGESWAQVGAVGLPNHQITCVKVNPRDPFSLYVSTSGYEAPNVFKSGDGGETFVPIHGNLPAIPVNSIEIDPENTADIYIGTDLGIWWSHEGGERWEPYGVGLPNTVVSDLHIMESGRLLRAGTYGRGLWEAPLNYASTVAVDEGGSGKIFKILDIFPNPLNTNEVSVRFSAKEAGRIRIQLFDVTGRLIEAPFDRESEAGIHRVQWQTRAANGVYFIKVREGQNVSVGKLVIQR